MMLCVGAAVVSSDVGAAMLGGCNEGVCRWVVLESRGGQKGQGASARKLGAGLRVTV
jgi:hypothetical protein